MYLGLGVDATQIQTQYPMHPTQETRKDLQSHILTGLSPSTVQAIPSQLQLNKKRSKSSPKHHISTYLTVRDSVCPVSSSLAVTNDIAYCFLFLHLLRCFNSVGSQSSTDQTTKSCLGSPIRQSWDQRMSAPTPSLTQLTTTFIGNSSPAIPQIVQVAIFS